VVSPEEHTATIPTVSTIGSAIGIIFYMSEVHGPTAPLPGAAAYLHIVNEIRFHYRCALLVLMIDIRHAVSVQA
jgi:hypothetical protein